ncbi:LamG-like jellyroll fold domain-containing protein [Planctomycetota bacterium]
MYKNMTFTLLVLALVGLVSPYAFCAADPNIIALYWFDTVDGARVFDESGNGRDGIMNGSVTASTEGAIGGSLQFSGGTVDITNNVDDLSFGDVDLSVTTWIKTGTQGTTFFSKDTLNEGNTFAFGVGLHSGNGNAVVTNRNRANIQSTSAVDTDEWTHLAFVQDYDEVTKDELWSMYVNGVLETRLLTDILHDNGQEGMHIGRGEEYTPGNWMGMIDELYVYGSVLDDADIPFVMNGATWKPRARDVEPVDGTTLSGTTVDLSWSAGWAYTVLGEHLKPVTHRVYLSTDMNAVTEGANEALVDTITDTTYSVDNLTPNTTYYWRIDEVNEAVESSPWTSEVLSFDVPDLAAKNPVPASGTKFQSVTLDLNWTPGLGATAHVVYLGNTYDEVENATTGGVTVTDPNYAPPGLQADKFYYWRVDEINGATIKGPVWMFGTVPVADGDHIDPNLIAWFKLNEGEGSTAVDYSGYGHHASFVGAGPNREPLWDEGFFGGAVRVWDGDGLGYVGVPGIEGFESPEVTICGWAYQETMVSGWNGFWASGHPTGSTQNFMQVNGNLRMNWPQNGYQWTHGWDVDTGLALPVGEWFFVAASVKPDGADLYINNASYHRDASFVPLQNLQYGAFLGRDKPKGTSTTLPGKVDDWRIYNKALSVAELAEVMRGEPWLAWNPQPGNGVMTDIEVGSLLSWSAGDGATAHDVYVTTDPNALHNADASDTTGVYRRRQVESVYPFDEVEAVMTYYWRIDEVQADDSIRKGNTWKFTTTDYLIIEDFEQYKDDDANAVWSTWMDGYSFPGQGLGGSFAGYSSPPYMEKIKTNSKGQSMPMPFSNDGSEFIDIDGGISNPVHSEVMLEFDEVQDWTRFDMKSLSVAFCGKADNVADRLYIAVTDVVGKRVVVDHPGNPNAVLYKDFMIFGIPLSDLADQGLDVTAVKSLALGVGTEGGPATGQGLMYFDDILLVPVVIEPNVPVEPNTPVLAPYLIADFDTDAPNADNWLNNWGSGGRFTARSLSTDTPDDSATAIQIDIDYSAGGWGSAWGAFSGTDLGPSDTNSVDASDYSYFSTYLKSSIDGAQLDFWFERFPGPTQAYVNQVTITGITTEWAYYEVDLASAVPIRDGLHDMTVINRMSFGGPANLGAPYTILLDNLKFIQNPGEGLLP